MHIAFAQYFKDPTLEPYLYVLSKRMENGHICIPVDNSIDDDLIEGGYSTEKIKITENELITFADNYDPIEETELKPFVFYNGKLYLQRYFVYENTILKKLKAFEQNGLLNEQKSKISTHKDFIMYSISREEDVSTYNQIEKIDWQAIAAIKGVLNNLTIITGGPGTGKTTTVAKILALLKRCEGKDLFIALAAPTGKAAMRMKESLMNSVQKYPDLEIDDIIYNIETFTIHRLLGANQNSPFFKHNNENPLQYDVVIIDESSMIGMSLFAKLVDAVKDSSRLILLGDSEQLASVDAGSLYGDICSSQKQIENKFTQEEVDLLDPLIKRERFDNITIAAKNGFLNKSFVRLKKTYRYDANAILGRFTKAIIEADVSAVETFISSEQTDSLYFDNEYNDNFITSFIKKYKEYILENNIVEALKKINNCRVLCAVRQGEHGVYLLNEKIKAALKREFSGSPDLFNPNKELFHNQLIMVTKNQPDLKLFNGDVGLIREIKGKLKVCFPITEFKDNTAIESYYEVSPGFIEAWETVFAMTIHKSQGSEFNEVLVVLPKNTSNRLLTRELLYTGVTRAKRTAYIQSSNEVLLTAIGQSVNRVSGLQERILKLS
jgi:exodeoxyribonuclease V alpha subunit